MGYIANSKQLILQLYGFVQISIFIYVYIYICIYICMCIYIYTWDTPTSQFVYREDDDNDIWI
jgi:hypothetical protein